MDDIIIFNNIVYYKTNVYNLIDGVYYVSKNGEIYSNKLKRLLSISVDKDGYERVNVVTKQGKRKLSVGKIILATFKGYPPKSMIDPTVEHKDGVRNNNKIFNLEWLERAENSSRRRITPKGEKNPKNKLSPSEVHEICTLLQDKSTSLFDIAQQYNVSKDDIRDIKRRRIWKDISRDFEF